MTDLDPGEPPFVDPARSGMVDGLLAVYDQLRRGEPATWVHLEAPSGWGKTRIVREFYRRLARERQPEPRYWPEDLLGSIENLASDVGARRKRLAPTVRHVPGSLPAYLWWGISCATRAGTASAALAADLDQLQAHAPYLEDAWRHIAPRGGRIAAGLGELGIAAADEAAMEIAGNVVEAVAGAAIPGLGLVRWLGERGVSGARAAAQRRVRLRSTDELVGTDIVEETAASITRLALPDLPVVIVIEDLHRADSAVADLLGALVTSAASVLVVTTAWPASTLDHEQVSAAMERAGGRLIRADHRSALQAPFPSYAGLGPLAAGGRAAIVQHYFPQIEQPTLEAVVERYPNPLALELFCQLPRVQRRSRGGRLAMSAEAIADTPEQIRGLYAELWQELPEQVREALSLAALGIPPTTDSAVPGTWNTPLLIEALRSLDWPSVDEIAGTLTAEVDAYSWARHVSALLSTFAEPDHQAVAAADDTFLFAEDRVEVRTAIAAAIAAFPTTHPTLTAAELFHLAELASALHAEGFLPDADVLAATVTAAAEHLFDEPREVHRLERLLDAALAAHPAPAHLRTLHLLRGHLELIRGRPDAALKQAALGTEHTDGVDLELLVLRARALEALDALPEAVVAHQQVADAVTSTHGPDHPDALAAQLNVAAAMVSAGHADHALPVLEQLLARHTQLLGPDDHGTLATRQHRSLALIALDRTPEAVADLSGLVQDYARVRGGAHPSTLSAQQLLGDALLRAGQVQQAVPLLSDHVHTCVETLGPDSPATLRARRSLAAATLGTAPEHGVHELESVYADQQRVLGPTHPDTLATSQWLTDAYLRAGRHEEMLAVLTSVVDAVGQVWGADDWRTLDARDNLARAYRTIGRDAEARSHYEDLLADLERLLGADHELARDCAAIVAQLRS